MWPKHVALEEIPRQIEALPQLARHRPAARRWTERPAARAASPVGAGGGPRHGAAGLGRDIGQILGSARSPRTSRGRARSPAPAAARAPAGRRWQASRDGRARPGRRGSRRISPDAARARAAPHRSGRRRRERPASSDGIVEGARGMRLAQLARIVAELLGQPRPPADLDEVAGLPDRPRTRARRRPARSPRGGRGRASAARQPGRSRRAAGSTARCLRRSSPCSGYGGFRRSAPDGRATDESVNVLAGAHPAN